MREKIEDLKKRLSGAQSVAVLTGAGVSAESGVPTFRGKDGLWKQHRAVDLATPEAFCRDPRLVWEFYNWRRELLAPLKPNAAHEALAKLEDRAPRFTLVTQNIDDLHRVAGSRTVLELHGNIWRVRCTRCGTVKEERRSPLPPLPRCADCGGLLRPHVVWFGESLDAEVLAGAYEAAEGCDVMLVAGTSGVVQPAASMGLHARERGAFVAEINLEPTPCSHLFHMSLLGKAGDILPQVAA